MLTIHADASKRNEENSLGFIIYADKNRIGELLFSFKDQPQEFSFSNTILEQTIVEISKKINTLLFQNSALIFTDQNSYSKKDTNIIYEKSHHHGPSKAASVHKLVYNAKLVDSEKQNESQTLNSKDNNVNHSQDNFKVITNDLYGAIKELIHKKINFFELPMSDVLKEIILNPSKYPISFKMLYNEKNMEKRDKSLLDFIDIHSNYKNKGKNYFVNNMEFPIYSLNMNNSVKLFFVLGKDNTPKFGTKAMAKANPYNFNINNFSIQLNQMYGISPKHFKKEYMQKAIPLEEALHK